MSKFIINSNGYWENPTQKGHWFDSKLNSSILSFIKEYKIKNAVDFGCGMATYAKNIHDTGISIDAFDGNPYTPELTNGFAKVIDLSKEFNLEKKYDCVISLEVGEHIPKVYENIYINNICNHALNWLILSWAIIDQPGDGHVNCQNNEYIIKKLSNNFIYQNDISNIFRNNTSLWWFKNTIMIFKKIQ